MKISNLNHLHLGQVLVVNKAEYNIVGISDFCRPLINGARAVILEAVDQSLRLPDLRGFFWPDGEINSFKPFPSSHRVI